MNRVTRRRLFGYGAAAAALLLVLLIAMAAFLAMQVAYRNPSPSNAVPALNCSPAPCADVQDFTLMVTNLKVDRDLVSMQVTFKNSSSATHASPEDLRLIDSKLHSSGLITDAPGCQTWSRHEFGNGATFGPINVCFRVTTADPPLVLRWSPDFGFFCCQSDIKLS
ncbi:MAG TPA: hypothetical protein VGJ79_04230 [Candidatus Dormibacteraeota bacterium]